MPRRWKPTLTKGQLFVQKVFEEVEGFDTYVVWKLVREAGEEMLFRAERNLSVEEVTRVQNALRTFLHCTKMGRAPPSRPEESSPHPLIMASPAEPVRIERTKKGPVIAARGQRCFFQTGEIANAGDPPANNHTPPDPSIETVGHDLKLRNLAAG